MNGSMQAKCKIFGVCRGVASPKHNLCSHLIVSTLPEKVPALNVLPLHERRPKWWRELQQVWTSFSVSRLLANTESAAHLCRSTQVLSKNLCLASFRQAGEWLRLTMPVMLDNLCRSSEHDNRLSTHEHTPKNYGLTWPRRPAWVRAGFIAHNCTFRFAVCCSVQTVSFLFKTTFVHACGRTGTTEIRMQKKILEYLLQAKLNMSELSLHAVPVGGSVDQKSWYSFEQVWPAIALIACALYFQSWNHLSLNNNK